VSMPSRKNARLFYRAARQRLDDASLLIELDRTTAAVYLAGYSVECMLKALILSTVASRRETEILETFRGGQAHSYDWLIRLYRQNGGTQVPRTIAVHFMKVNTWSTDLRYLPGKINASEANAFLSSVDEINRWIDGRL
jgi:hypothetical protein